MRQSFNLFVVLLTNGRPSILVPLGYAVCKYVKNDTLIPLEDIDIQSELELMRHEHENEMSKDDAQDSTYDRILSSVF
jgi:hypothetical protein